MQTPTLQTTKPVASLPPSSDEPNQFEIDRTRSRSPQFADIMEQHAKFPILNTIQESHTKEVGDPEIEGLATNAEKYVSPMESSPEFLQQESTVSLQVTSQKANLMPLTLSSQNEGLSTVIILVSLSSHADGAPNSDQEDISTSSSSVTIANTAKHYQLRSAYELALLPLGQTKISPSERMLNNTAADKTHNATLKTVALPTPSSPLHQPTIHTIQSASVVTNIAQSMEAANRTASIDFSYAVKSSGPEDPATHTSQIKSTIPLAPQTTSQLWPPAPRPFNSASISEVKIERDNPSENSDGRLGNFLETKPAIQSGQTHTAHRSEFSHPIARQIADAVHARVTAEKLIEVSLNPAELGRLKLSLSPAENGLVINVTVERTETLELIKRNISDLEQAFTEQGHENISFSFEQSEHSFGADRQPHFEEYSTSVDDPQILATEPITTNQNENARPATSGVDIRV